MKWLRYWYIPVIAIAGLILWGWKRRGPADMVKLEMKAIDASVAAKKMQVEYGTQKALDKIYEEHKESIAKLHEEQARKMDRLSDDPAALAKYLVRLGG